jgi:hypothetical protein
MESRRLSAPRFSLEFLDLFRGACFGQRTVKLFTGLSAESLQVGNLGSSHRFLPGDPLLRWFFRVWSGFGVHHSKFATGKGEGLTQSSKTALTVSVAITGSHAQIPKLPKNLSLLPLLS